MGRDPLILIDAGHGHLKTGVYQTPGKRYADDAVYLYEGVLNKAVAYNLALRLSITGIRCEIINPHNYDVSLDTRCRRANVYHRDYSCLYLSIHHNAGRGEGFEIYTSIGDTLADPIAEVAANIFLKMFPKRIFRPNRVQGKLAKEARFRVLHKTLMPAVLTEFGFMDTFVDRVYISSDKGITDQVTWLHHWIEYLIKKDMI